MNLATSFANTVILGATGFVYTGHHCIGGIAHQPVLELLS